MHENRLSYLFDKLLNQSISADERAELQQLMSNEGAEAQLEELVQRALEETPVEYKMEEQSAGEVLNAIFFADRQPSIPAPDNIVPVSRRRWWRTAAAAAILAGMLTSGYMIWSGLHTSRQQVVKVEDVLPGSTKARLTLSDGSVVNLDNKGRQTINQGNASIRQSGGELDYEPQNSKGPLAYNTLMTPRGGQFKIKLPDGTNVWINAASSLKYPTAFTGGERVVEVRGEAYFEVAADHNKPFKVVINDHYAILVLGTSFNIKAYADEAPFNTTLLEGSVRATLTGANEKSIVIKPGQQVQLRENDRSLQLVKDVNIDQEMAWRYGNFNFEGQTLEEVMKQISRWYDIDVVFESGVPPISFGGGMSRDVNLKVVLDFLRDSRIHFRLEENGKRLIVTK